ncbi:MAG: TldD/PmbA family protein [Clostridia bacterium]|nr:TldD/PmbA family protein [Clostridia bacterium]
MDTTVIEGAERFFVPSAHTEIRVQKNRTRRVTLVAGNMSANARNESSGVSSRVYKNGVYGFSSMAATDKSAIASVARAAAENAEFMSAHVGKGTAMFPEEEKRDVSDFSEHSDVPQSVYIEAAKAVDGYIRDRYPKLQSRTVVCTADSTEKILVSSDGAYGRNIISRGYIYSVMKAETPSGSPVELMRVFGGGETFDKLFGDMSEVYSGIDAQYENIMKKREGVYPEAGVRTCILGGSLSGMIAHEAVGHTVEADLVLGGSVAAHSLGKRVASDLVNLTDFANTAFGERVPLPVYLDDEGTPAVDAPLIRDGILVGYMNSRETAAGFGMKPTGNARAYGFSDEPLIRMRNTAIHPGKDSLEDMIASVDDGYYLISTNNGQADTTGEFMFGVCMGYEIKHGKLGRAILDTTVTGVAFEMMKTIDMVSDRTEWDSSGFCGKKQPMAVGLGGPALRCKITIGGR